MIETPTIITSRRRPASVIAPEFTFSEDHIPNFSDDKAIIEYRQQAWQAFQALPMPLTTDEPWRRTDIHTLQSDRFQLAGLNSTDGKEKVPAQLLKPLAGKSHGGQIVLSASGAAKSISEDLEKQGVVFTDLKTAEEKHPGLLAEVLGKVVSPNEGKFAALAAALSRTGILLYVPRHVQIDTPLHSLLWGQGTGLAYLSHILVYLEEGASVTYVHESASPEAEAGQIMHAGIVELFVGREAHLGFVELQSWGQNVWNFSHERARIEQDGSIDWIFGAIGSRLTKNFSELSLAGRGAVGKMSGFYFTNNQQHLDHDTQQNHLAPHTTSDLLFKGALLDESRSVWQGMIYVAPDAVKTDGYQANRNIVLSRNARADSIPGLEILADDVRCTHGATVGKIDPELVFYLVSRGIPEKEAEKLVVQGFFDPIMQRIPFEGVRDRFQAAITKKMKTII
jgi:Fe-S cluster assembly protein SufD